MVCTRRYTRMVFLSYQPAKSEDIEFLRKHFSTKLPDRATFAGRIAAQGDLELLIWFDRTVRITSWTRGTAAPLKELGGVFTAARALSYKEVPGWVLGENLCLWDGSRPKARSLRRAMPQRAHAAHPPFLLPDVRTAVLFCSCIY